MRFTKEVYSFNTGTENIETTLKKNQKVTTTKKLLMVCMLN